MEVTFLGRSAFRLRGKEVTIVTDPYPPSKTLSMGKVTADVVTLSRPGVSPTDPPLVGGEPRLVAGPGEYEVADVLIAGVATASEPGVGPVNTAYVMRLDDLTVCHLGDITGKLTDKQVEEIGSIDVLLVPVGGDGTLGPAQAAEVVSQLEPSFVVPMRYKLEGADDDLEAVDVFCREMGTKEVVPEAKLSVTKGALAGEVRVVVLENRRI